MSLLGWFSRKSADEEVSSTTLPRDSTRPPGLGSSRKVERNARRERLYGVVRETMVKAGVLSSAYRFKVLSLDGRGRQFLVMVDLVGEPVGPAELSRIETAMLQAAKAQHGIVIKAVYWRQAPGAAGPSAQAHEAAPHATASAAPLAAVAPKVEPTAPEPPQQDKQDKLAELEQALAAGDARPHARSFDGATVQGPQSYTLLTGFEDTELGVPVAPPPAAAKKSRQP